MYMVVNVHFVVHVQLVERELVPDVLDAILGSKAPEFATSEFSLYETLVNATSFNL